MIFISYPTVSRSLTAVSVSVLLGLAVGCGGGGSSTPSSNNLSTPADTSGITPEKLKAAETKGMTQGITSTFNAVTSVASNAPALNEVTTRANGLQTRSAPQGRAADSSSSSSSSSSSGIVDETVRWVDELINVSTVTQSGNVFTIDPDEGQICSSSELSTDEASQCNALLPHFTMTVTVNQVVNDEVTAATTALNYDATPFAKVDFTETTGYYEIELPGTKTLLTGIGQVDPQLAVPVPDTMNGAIRLAFAAPTENSGTLTLSIPQTVEIINTAPGEEINFNLASTNKLMELTANAATNDLGLEIGMGALDILAPGKDSTDNPITQRLVMQALSGKLALTDNGNKLQLTGLTANTLQFKVNNQDAMTLNLEPLDALLDASNANASVLTLQKALKFNLHIQNLSGVFSDIFDTADPNAYLTATANAPSGLTITELGETLAKVDNGTLDVSVDNNGTVESLSAPAGSCIDSSGSSPQVAACQ